MNREERRHRTQKVIDKRRKFLDDLPQKDCLFIRTLMAEPHRLHKKVDCSEECTDKTCPFYSELKQNRPYNKSYKLSKMRKS